MQARTDAEREESEGEVSEEEPEEENDDDIPYNPKNLPLGWDGKPIPYWLYKVGGRRGLERIDRFELSSLSQPASRSCTG